MVASYLAYLDYSESGVVWFGKIPSHWRVEPFKRSIDKNDGGVWGIDPVGDSDTIVLRSTEQTVDGNWEISDPAIRHLSDDEINKAILKEDDLLLTKSSGSALHIGKTTLVTNEIASLKCCYSNFMQRIRLNSKILPKLAWYILNNKLARVQFDFLSNSTTGLANLNGTMIGDLLLPVSPVSEQMAIANFLDHETAKIETLIDKQQQLIKLLKEKRQAVISHAVTKGLNPDAPMKDSGVEWLGEVPEHWDVTRLKYECSSIVDCMHSTPQYDPDGEYPAIRTADISPGFLNVIGARKVSEIVFNERNGRHVPEYNDIIYSREGERYGMAALVPENTNVCLAQRVMLFRVKCPDSASFLMWHLNSNSVYMQAYQDVIGATSPHINVETIKNFYMAWPPLNERQYIAAHISSRLKKFDKLAEKAEAKITLLQERRTALISAAVTGKIDVRSWKPE